MGRPSRIPQQFRKEGASGYIVVLLLLAAFGYGVYHVMRAESTGREQTFRMGPVEANLESLFVAAQIYFVDTGAEETRYDDLVGPGRYLPRLISVYGEDYTRMRIGEGDLSIAVSLPNGPSVGYEATALERDNLRASAEDSERRRRLLRQIGG
ncbi:MAG: hypothetical protein JJU00_03045 [Opitutales bacterium]|nr:hypothetical protein [Opitutales bacterium]